MRGLRIVVLTLMCGCVESSATHDAGLVDVRPACTPLSASVSFVLSSIPDVTLQMGIEHAEGANIDARVSDVDDVAGCRVPDFVDLERGDRGIDNQLASLKPAIENWMPGELDLDESLIRNRVSFDVEVAPRDPSDGQGCVFVTMRTSSSTHEGTGFVDDEGRVRARLDGVWEHVGVLVESDEWRLEQINLLLDPELDRAVLSGALPLDDFIGVISLFDEDPPPETVDAILESLADLDRRADGICHSMSAGFLATRL